MDKQKIFTTIKSFVSEINNTYGSQYKHLAMYGRLIEKTNMTHEIPVGKHIAAFKKFAVANRDAIVSKDYSLFKFQKIKYSENVCFNIVNIFKLAETDQDATDTIWEHLLVLSAMLDPKSDAKKKLKSDASASSSAQPAGGDMSQMLLPLMNMFTNSMINPSDDASEGSESGANPLAALLGGAAGGAGGASGGGPNLTNIFGDIMSSGILPKMMNTFTECVGENNQIDFKKLLDSVQDMVKDMNVDIPTGANPDSKEDIDSLLGAFENVGLSKDTMKSVVDNIVTDLQKGGGLPSASEETVIPVVETVESCTTLVDTGLVDLTEPVVPSEDVQVCYIGGGGCCSVPQ